MGRDQMEQRTLELFQSGFHCAESVAGAVVEAMGGDWRGAMRAAAAFGGGVGRTKCELCGALSGGLVALGALRGRQTPEDWQPLADQAAELRRRFVEENGSARCGELMAAFGPQEDMRSCKRMSAKAAGMVADLLLD